VLLLVGGADVTLDQARVPGEVRVLEQPPPARDPGLAVAGDQEDGRSALGVERGHALQEVGGDHPLVAEVGDHVGDPRAPRRVVVD
jgi:hypothetical protein